MTSDTVRTYFLFNHELSSELIREVIHTSLELGCTTTEDGGTNVCTYKSKNERHDGIPVDEAISVLSDHKDGYIVLWYEELRVCIEFNIKSLYAPEMTRISLKVWESQFKVYPDKTTEEGAKRRAHQLIELIRPLAELTKPTYVYGLAEKYPPEKVRPTEQQIKSGDIDRLFWLNIFSNHIVTQIGRDKLLSAPAWKVEELSGEQILLIMTPRPRFYDDKAREIEEYLGI